MQNPPGLYGKLADDFLKFEKIFKKTKNFPCATVAQGVIEEQGAGHEE